MWMWKMKQCGCNPVQEQFEFPILDNIFTKINNENLNINNCCRLQKDKENFCELKNKVICDFQQIIKKLECGIQPDLEFLLEEISYIYIYDNNTVLFEQK